MTKSELNKFRNILEAKQAELEQLVRNRDGIAIEKSPDALDEVQHAAERELAIRNLDRESNLLRNVRAALRRIDDGASACACTAKRTSVPSGWPRCRGPRSASAARRSPTAIRRATARRASTSCWSTRPNREINV